MITPTHNSSGRIIRRTFVTQSPPAAAAQRWKNSAECLLDAPGYLASRTMYHNLLSKVHVLTLGIAILARSLGNVNRLPAISPNPEELAHAGRYSPPFLQKAPEYALDRL
jgi:hypothetical protein